jgi:hypothetical protein
MSLRDDMLQSLQAVVGQSNQQVLASQGRRTVRCEVDRCEPLAAAVYELALESDELAGVDIAKLQQASESLCRRVNYLLEPISPIESDADSCTVQMRSSPPQQQEAGRFYYELLLRRGGTVMLRRYEKQPGAIRTRVAATLIHEVIGRLVDDFSQTLDEASKS